MRTETQWGREGEIESAHTHTHYDIMIYVLCTSRYTYTVYIYIHIYTACIYTCTHGPNNNLLILSIAPTCPTARPCICSWKLWRWAESVRVGDHGMTRRARCAMVLCTFFCATAKAMMQSQEKAQVRGHTSQETLLISSLRNVLNVLSEDLKTWNMLKLFTFGLYPWLYQISDFPHATWKNQVGWWGRWSK